MLNSSIGPIDWTLLVTTTPGQSGPRSNSNKEVLCISQSSNIIEASSLDCLVSYSGHSLGQGFTSLQRCSWCILQLTERYALLLEAIPCIFEYHPILSGTIFLTFAAGNCRPTSWPKPSFVQLFTNIKFVTGIWCDPRILNENVGCWFVCWVLLQYQPL